MSVRPQVKIRVPERRAREVFLFDKKREAAVRMCLVYPNRYAVGMGNLGFQTVYALADQHPGFACERAFLPESGDRRHGAREALRALESGCCVADFDIVAFSISFEADYLNLVPMIENIGLQPRRCDRTGHRPLLLAGGPATFLNPEPIADFFDLFLLGEAEEMLPEFLDLYLRCRARNVQPAAILEQAASEIGGAYVPACYEAEYDGPMLRRVRSFAPAAAKVERRLILDLNRFRTTTRVLAEDAVFGEMVLVEASRGCQWGCRFCAAGYMYRPVRTRSPEFLSAAVRDGLAHRKTIGLVGAEMASVPGVDKVAELVVAAGGRVSPSSLKADCVTPRLAKALARGGAQSVTVAPEAGSERMRRVINKNLTEADILRATDLLVGEGVRNLKLYFMIGLPAETRDDVRAIVDLAEKTRARLCEKSRPRGRVGKVTLSVNPFVPKPWTPFQWDPMEGVPALRAKANELRRACGRIPNLNLVVESPREAYLQTLLSRGDRRISRVLEAIHDAGGDWWRVIRRWQAQGLAGVPAPAHYVHRSYGECELLPWDFIDHRVDKGYLRAERRKAFAARQTPPCDTATCRTCAACSEQGSEAGGPKTTLRG